MQVTSAYAKANFLDLLKAVENGETVEITRYHKPIAILAPHRLTQRVKPQLGTAPSSLKIIEPNCAKALTAKQMQDLI